MLQKILIQKETLACLKRYMQRRKCCQNLKSIKCKRKNTLEDPQARTHHHAYKCSDMLSPLEVLRVPGNVEKNVSHSKCKFFSAFARIQIRF